MQLRDVASGEVTTESLRQARALAGSSLDPSAAAGHRPPGDLPGEDRAGREADPRVDRARHELPRRDGEVLGLPDGAAGEARGRRRRRVHRPRDGGEPGSARVRGDRGRDGGPGPRSARSGVRAHRRGLPRDAWRARRARRRSRRIRAVRERHADGVDAVRQPLSGRHRDPRARRAARYHAREHGRDRDRRARRDPRRRADAHEQPRHLRRRRRRRGAGTSSPASGA